MDAARALQMQAAGRLNQIGDMEEVLDVRSKSGLGEDGDVDQMVLDGSDDEECTPSSSSKDVSIEIKKMKSILKNKRQQPEVQSNPS